MTSSKRVKIADLKTNLSRHLRDVRGGQSIIVVDRETPIATIVAYGSTGEMGIDVRPPMVDPSSLGSIRSPLKQGLSSSLPSSLEILSELRGDKR